MPTSFGFLSSYPPTQCGLATFTAALRSEVMAAGHHAGVVRVVVQPDPAVDPGVVEQWVHDQPGAVARTAAALNAFDVVVVQHEFGIYAGPDGDGVVDVLQRLTTPTIVVLHTVLVAPTPHQRMVLEAVARCADVLVTMTATARRRLVDHYDIDDAKVVVIPHGAHASNLARVRHQGDIPMMLTWGLLGPGKGIERVIDALPSLRDLVPRPHYLVIGDTHPRVFEREGERYRNSLVARAERLGVADMVTFEAGYVDVASLGSITADADVVILPYDSREQVTSGVLIEAVTARRPVIATAFAHAVELLQGGAGLVVDHDDPGAMSAAIRRVLCEPAKAASMVTRASVLAPELVWSAVAARYVSLADDLVTAGATAVA
jgi:polysaccharide biosynthesis protein PslF